MTRARHILLVSSDQIPLGPWRDALVEAGASCTLTSDLRQAADLGRRSAFDLVLVAERASYQQTALLAQLLRGTANGRPLLQIVRHEAQPAHGPEFDGQLRPEPVADTVHGLLGAAAGRGPRRRIAASPLLVGDDPLPEPWSLAGPQDSADLVILDDEGGAAAVLARMSAARAAVVPVITVGAGLGRRGDVHIASPERSALEQALRDVEPIVAAVERLPAAWFEAQDPRLHVLARLAARGGAAHPVRDGAKRTGIHHPDQAAIPEFPRAAEDLVRTGHLTRRFFDRVHACPQCDSARMNVREECASCRSGNIVEEAILHHLRCGYQGPERDFQEGRALVCPKCRQALEHFSVDYDKPGFLYCCDECGHATGDTAIGFVCFDCSAHSDASRLGTRTYHSYALTEAGRERASLPPPAGASEPAPRRNPIRDFVEARRGRGRIYALLILRIDPGQDASALSSDLCEKVVALAHSLLLEIFTDEVEIVRRGSLCVALIPDESPDHVRAAAPRIAEQVSSMLRPPASIGHDVLGPDQVALLL